MKTRLGLEAFLDNPHNFVDGKAVGLLASPSSIDHELTSAVECLFVHQDVNLAALFGPEHGLRGDAQAGGHVENYVDPRTSLNVYSLYGDTRNPTPNMLQGLDTVVVDLQDAGVRFYTYLATLTNLMEVASQVACEVVILDRPAPLNGINIEGPVLNPDYQSFVGPYPIPIRYGMTIGEIAILINEHFGIACELQVIQMENWSRELWFDQTGIPFIPSSPNLPTLVSMTVYPGTCLFEGTNLSEGRGTTRPFEYIGAPWINAEGLAKQLNQLELPGVRFRPVYFVPTFSKHEDQLCAGVQVYVSDRNWFQPVTTALHMLKTIKTTYPDHFEWQERWGSGERNPIDLLCGGNLVRKHLDANGPITELVDMWQEELMEFEQIRATYLLYPGS